MDLFKKFQEPAETKGLWRKVCCIKDRLDNQIAIVTGANGGLGEAITIELARRGCKVIMGCRNLERAEQTKQNILDKFGPNNREGLITDIAEISMVKILTPITEDLLIPEKLDLSSLDSVRKFSDRIGQTFTKLNYLINNAAIMSQTYEETNDGLELCIGVNYLGHFLLTELLLPLMKNADSARIVNIASSGHYLGKLHKPDLRLEGEDYGPYVAYNQSKLACVMHATELAKRLEDTNVIAVSVHPGFLKTNLQRECNTWKDKLYLGLTNLQSVSPWQGAQTVLYVLLSKNIEPGSYYEDCETHMPDFSVLREDERKWLWNKSCELVGI